jgi:hypothetical protein
MSLNGSNGETIIAYHVGVRCRRAWRGTQSPCLQCASIRPVLPPATLDRPSMDHLSLKLDDSHCGVLVRVQLHKCETAISLHAYLRKISNRLEERDQIRLSAVRDEIANVDGSVVRGSLLHDCFVREGTAQEVHRGWSSPATTHR